MTKLSLQHIDKIYANGVQAIKDVNLDISDREMIVLTGPPGSGKSTLLNMIEGLEPVSQGEIYIGETCINRIASQNREVALVSASYAMYPALTVYENIAFGLRLQHCDPEKIDQKVRYAAKILEIEDILEVDGGELDEIEERLVSIARAIAREPKFILMDEPFSNLKREIRNRFIKKMPELCERMGISVIYASSDPEDAFALDRQTVVINEGKIQQIGMPEEIYQSPVNLFVADFFGNSPVNLISGQAATTDEGVAFNVFQYLLDLPEDTVEKLAKKDYLDKKIVAGIRPEHILIEEEEIKEHEGQILSGVVREVLGEGQWLLTEIGKLRLTIPAKSGDPAKVGDKVQFAFNFEDIHFFDINTERRIF
jgi:multiple sugar transport system ATP-binding protein